MNPENENPHKMSLPFQQKVDNEGDTNENNGYRVVPDPYENLISVSTS